MLIAHRSKLDSKLPLFNFGGGCGYTINRKLVMTALPRRICRLFRTPNPAPTTPNGNYRIVSRDNMSNGGSSGQRILAIVIFGK